MGRIQVLDDHIANQIAAGEVVERPSSVVKELVENAIDAGSTRIDVHIEEGGLQLIRVTDNGSGIAKEDCEIAFQRHATSKIRTNRDLFRIRSLGFRGEALASIAAVSKTECLTATDESGLGRRLIIEGGTIVEHKEDAAQKGTDIRVRDLFYNTPARLKYMKTIQTELGHISDYMYRLALANPNISITLKHNEKELLRTLGNGDLLQVIAAVYGTATAKKMLPLKGQSLDYQISGYVGRPELTRANRNGISFIINGRYIRNYALAGALLKAYHTLLPIHRFPMAIIHIEMDPELIDVNVHPAKLEVRFSKETELVQCIQQTVESTLQGEMLIPQVDIHHAQRTKQKPSLIQEQLPLYESFTASTLATHPSVSKLKAETEGSEQLRQGKKRDPQAQLQDQDTNRSVQPQDIPMPKLKKELGSPPQVKVNWQDSTPHPDLVRRLMDSVIRQGQVEETQELDDQETPLSRLPKLHPIGQMHGLYIIAYNEDGLYIIDQHAAHERIHYETFYHQFGRPVEASQELLLPITLEFTPNESELLKERLQLFQQVGVYLEPFGGNTFKVTSYPYWLPKGQEVEIITEMAEWVLNEKRAPDVAKLREQSAILCACKAAIKANQHLSSLAIEQLLEQLRKTRNPFTCPHGRPIVISFSTYELEKMFKRVM